MLEALTKKGKTLILAYDHGLEHGPKDFNNRNVDPNYILNLALEGEFNAVVLQKGIALKYYAGFERFKKVPLILKLNGKTSFLKNDPYSPLNCTVEQAVKLGAKAVGYTIYVGSKNEARMFEEFAKIENESHKRGLPVIAWMYPRGKGISELKSEVIAYSARIGLELGADLIKIKYNGKPKELEWAVKCAGNTKVVIAGGLKKEENLYLKQVKEVMKAGAIGIAVGRNVWQRENPLEISKKLRKIIFGKN